MPLINPMVAGEKPPACLPPSTVRCRLVSAAALRSSLLRAFTRCRPLSRRESVRAFDATHAACTISRSTFQCGGGAHFVFVVCYTTCGRLRDRAVPCAFFVVGFVVIVSLVLEQLARMLDAAAPSLCPPRQQRCFVFPLDYVCIRDTDHPARSATYVLIIRRAAVSPDADGLAHARVQRVAHD